MPPSAISSRISKRSTRSPLENVESEPKATVPLPARDLSARKRVPATRSFGVSQTSAGRRWRGGGLGQLGAVAGQVLLGDALRVQPQRAGVLGDVAAHVDGRRHVRELLFFQR